MGGTNAVALADSVGIHCALFKRTAKTANFAAWRTSFEGLSPSTSAEFTRICETTVAFLRAGW